MRNLCSFRLLLPGGDPRGGANMAALVQMACWFHGRLAVRAGGVRPLIPGLVPAHFRSFSLRRNQEEQEELEENPFYSRYREQIQRARRWVCSSHCLLILVHTNTILIHANMNTIILVHNNTLLILYECILILVHTNAY